MRMPVVVTGERSGLLSKIYDDPKYNAAFDRCIDVMTKLMLKYGNQVLERPPDGCSCFFAGTARHGAKQLFCRRCLKVYNLHVV